jgi:adenylylsulfate kinase-like enzyme
LRTGFVIWFVGLPAAGKTTVAQVVRTQLAERNIHSVLLDSDELRTLLTPTPTYSDAERVWFYQALVGLAAWLARSGVNVLIAATANRQAYRQAARAQIARFAEVYVQCSLATCRRRDPKGIYARAAQGQAEHAPGVGSPFEPPEQPEATISTETDPPAAAATAVLAQLADFLTKSDE